MVANFDVNFTQKMLALCAIDFGTITGFNTVIAIATEGFCVYLTFDSVPYFLSENGRFIVRYATWCTSFQYPLWAP